jgi:glycosyltransferase involved in cell wall biosynthesis
VEKFLENYKFINIEIIIKPLLTREELSVEFSNANMFLFSSISEGMPVSMIEALACGLPVLTTNCGGVDDLVNMKNGRIFPVKDYNSMAQYMLDFLNKKITFNNKWISNEIISRFGAEAFKARLLDVYDSI